MQLTYREQQNSLNIHYSKLVCSTADILCQICLIVLWSLWLL